MEAKPLRTVPSSHNTSGVGGGPQKKIDMGHKMVGDVGVVVVDERKRVVVVKEEKENTSSYSVELHLGVDASHSAPQEINHVITEAQRRELHHQVFIFNHLAYNLPPPYHLVQFPSNMSEYSFLGFDHGSMVDPEPHRCRRTDGKKWRCGKNVVPNQKYCERHMHRGRNRSRKPVETSQINSHLATKPSSKSHNKPASRTQFEISNPNLMAIRHSDTSMSPGSTLATPVAPKMATFSSVTSIASDRGSCLNICQKDNKSKSCISNNISVKSGGKGRIVGDTNGISTGIGFSPTSVLQVSGCNPSYLNDRTNIESASGRCRRTDGKKWQCKSAVLPGQKYCATHMHRGAKKRLTSHEPAVTIARLPNSSVTTKMQKAHCAIPNTNLSMSVPASEPFIQCNEKSQSTSDTDTTISDTLNECSYASF
ncbi:hypothetical protein GLYMA_01G144900v4 [Glycine max]|uniref:Growth-regulating factor n=1 Tax=Glycine soja TaxID=3848 RepID=A0A445M356_GLYSO|nr:growth-regulating factor 9 isoform X3 [Glycine max]XP_028238741.1 growth-regulating factor 9-like isoform X3 [Glycine soja]KAG4403570.1 hypothetical protein GLYMA_01G144900v4 [Glycine max]KAH1163089.1 hypothetical protein GYH30_001574 [Glycine max]RZC29978.1 Growth-regulating factor 9 isoform E [Glycine soja]|eukprot:XP_006573445.1 growth-regulating factor 9 isoform X3 [Glycine max]